jgi:hypothetical protein
MKCAVEYNESRMNAAGHMGIKIMELLAMAAICIA